MNIEAKKAKLLILKRQVAELETEIFETSINPEIHAKAVETLAYIAENTKNKNLKKLCQDTLERCNINAVIEISQKYRKEGIEECIAKVKEKMQTAKDLNSTHSVLLLAVVVENLEKLLEEDLEQEYEDQQELKPELN